MNSILSEIIVYGFYCVVFVVLGGAALAKTFRVR